MARMTDPLGAFSATLSAPANVAPPEMPVKMPSFLANACAVLTASLPSTLTRSSYKFMFKPFSRTNGMKSGVQPCTGCAAKAGCEPFGAPVGLRSVLTPLVTRAAASGSSNTTLVSGRDSLSVRATP